MICWVGRSGVWALVWSCSQGPVDVFPCRKQHDQRTMREEVAKGWSPGQCPLAWIWDWDEDPESNKRQVLFHESPGINGFCNIDEPAWTSDYPVSGLSESTSCYDGSTVRKPGAPRHGAMGPVRKNWDPSVSKEPCLALGTIPNTFSFIPSIFNLHFASPTWVQAISEGARLSLSLQPLQLHMNSPPSPAPGPLTPHPGRSFSAFQASCRLHLKRASQI